MHVDGSRSAFWRVWGYVLSGSDSDKKATAVGTRACPLTVETPGPDPLMCRQQHLTRQTVSVHFLIPDLIAAFAGRREGQARGREAVRRRRRLEVRLAPGNHSHGREWTISSLTLSGRSSTG